MAEPTLDARQKRALAAALLACPSMADRGRRDAIVRELPADIQHSITRSDAGLLDVTNTLNAALNYPHGLDTLIDLVRIFEGDSLPMREMDRVLAESARAAPATPVFSQPRIADGPSGSKWTLQSPVQMAFVRIPAGEFLMGSDPDLDQEVLGHEQPQHRVCLPEYYIGEYPVTVAQYEAFARATRREARGPQGGPDHPVTRVNWREANTFCRWLSQRSGLAVRLPTEAEWEKAARGTDGRIYPWGDALPDAGLCNFNMNVNGTTPVGKYPAGASPYGALDMAGNVWEWTSSRWGEDRETPTYKYPYNAEDGREDPVGSGLRVVRGGSWSSYRRRARCASRDRFAPIYFDLLIGFRVVVSLTSTGFPP